MENLDGALRSEFPLTKNTSVKLADVIVFVMITVFALFARAALFGYVSGDYTNFLEKWFRSLQEAGGLPGLGLSLGDYTPPYILIMSLLTYFPMSSLISIKLVSCVFDFVLAFAAMGVVYHHFKKTETALAAYGIVLFLPTVLLNSAFWAQCDGIFTSFLLLCVYYFLKDRPFAGTLCFAVAFTFKLQAIFLAPLLVFLWLKGRMKFRYFFLIPGVYLVSILPAWMMGRSLRELLTIYLNQSGQYSRICLNAPNLYYFINEDTGKALSTAAIFLCGTAVAGALYLLFIKKYPLTDRILINAALFFALLLPYLLPHMHERYFYVADVLAVVYAFYRPKRFYVPVMVVFSSMAGYLPFLFGHTPIDLGFAALVMLAALLIVACDLFRPVLTGNESIPEAVPAVSAQKKSGISSDS